MLISTIPNLLQMSDGAIPEGITGVITRIYPGKMVGEGDRAGYMQKGILSGEGKTIEICFKDKEEFKAAETVNRKIYITCTVNGRKQLTGIKRTEYNGKAQVWVYGNADVAFDDAEQQQPAEPEPQRTAAPQRQPQQQQAPQQQRPAPQQQQRPANPPANSEQQQAAPAVTGAVKINGARLTDEQLVVNFKHVRRELLREANLYLFCVEAADWVRAEYEKMNGPNSMPQSQYEGIPTTLFIQAQRNFLCDYVPKVPMSSDWRAKHLPKPADNQPK